MTGHDDMHPDLLLDAFRYAADEMPDAERERFEQRLAVDQAAREAVARTVGISQALAVVTVPAARPTKKRLRRLAWMATAAAGICAAFLIGRSLSDGEQAGEQAAPVAAHPAPSPDVEPHGMPRAEDLLSLWLRPEGAETGTAELLPAAPETELLAESDLAVPDWMLAAVSTEEMDGLDGTTDAVQEN